MVKQAFFLGAHWKITTAQEARNKTTIHKFKRDKAINSNGRNLFFFILHPDSPIKRTIFAPHKILPRTYLFLEKRIEK
jgi:hypothetical protein